MKTTIAMLLVSLLLAACAACPCPQEPLVPSYGGRGIDNLPEVRKAPYVIEPKADFSDFPGPGCCTKHKGKK